MSKLGDIYFEDESFPIVIGRYCASRIVREDESSPSKAMHEAIEIKYFYEGGSTLLIDRKTVVAKKGDIIVINPYEFHSTVKSGNSEGLGRYHRLNIGLDLFDGLRVAKLDLKSILLGEGKGFVTKIENDTELCRIFDCIVEEDGEARAEKRLAIFGLVSQLFVGLVRHGLVDLRRESGAGPDAIRSYSTIEPALRLIRDNYASRIDIEMLAGACNISKYHFCRIFKQVMGMSAIQYLNSYRLKIADIMLSNSQLDIAGVALACGFQNPSYFSKEYKRHFEKTPRMIHKN